MKVLLKIAYLGTSYAGFQAQRGASCRTVQQTLTDAVSKAVGKPCLVTGCSRTDSGVHAKGFCATIEPADGGDITIPLDKIPVSVNHYLPDDVAVLNAAAVPEDFHPRYDVKSKDYIYVFSDAPTRDPFSHGRVTYLKQPLAEESVRRMNEATEHFVGTHDFASFMAQGSKITDTVRTVFSASVSRKGNSVEFRVCADGFLYNMVRIMAGTLLSVGQNKMELFDVKKAVMGKDRSLAGVTAAACGLYLNRVEYKKSVEWVFPEEDPSEGGAEA